jgi:hypothetical protein
MQVTHVFACNNDPPFLVTVSLSVFRAGKWSGLFKRKFCSRKVTSILDEPA